MTNPTPTDQGDERRAEAESLALQCKDLADEMAWAHGDHRVQCQQRNRDAAEQTCNASNEKRREFREAIDRLAALAAPHPSQGAELTETSVMHLWETHAGFPTEKFPLTKSDVLTFASALLHAAAPPQPVGAEAGKGVSVGWYSKTGHGTFFKENLSPEHQALKHGDRFIWQRVYLAPSESVAVSGEVSEDTKRLDWLDANNARFKMGWDVGMAPAGNVSIKSVIQLGGKLTSIREAIDAVLALAGSGKSYG